MTDLYTVTVVLEAQSPEEMWDRLGDLPRRAINEEWQPRDWCHEINVISPEGLNLWVKR